MPCLDKRQLSRDIVEEDLLKIFGLREKGDGNMVMRSLIYRNGLRGCCSLWVYVSFLYHRGCRIEDKALGLKPTNLRTTSETIHREASPTLP